MKHTIIYLDYALHRGGAEVSLEMLIRALKGKFNQILYIHKASKIISSNAKVRYVNIPENVLKTKRDSLNALKAVFHLILAAFYIRERGIVVSNTYKAHFTGIAAKLMGFKWVIIERDITESAPERLMKRIIYRIADTTVFVSNFAKRANKGRGPVINNMIDKGYMDKKCYIAYAGDFTIEKGFDRIISIMKNNRNSKYKYAVIGEIPHYSNMKIEIPDHVEHIRYTDNIYDIFSRTAILLLLNRKRESFSRVVSEAMACGAVPVVLKGNGTDDYIVDNNNGIILDSYEEDNVVEAINRLMDDDAIKSMSSNAIATSDKFSSEEIFREWDKLFSRL